MKKILKKKNSVFFVMLLLFLTKVLGFFKLRTIAQLFGVSHELDIFWAAFTIPDMLFMILVAGSINAAVIPIFSDIFRKDGKEALNIFFNYLTLIIAFVCTLIAVILFIFTPQLTNLLIEAESLQRVLNFTYRMEPDDFNLFVNLTRLMMISPVLLGISSLVTAYLQTRKQFFVTSLAPLFYNLSMIIGSLILVSIFGMGVEGIAISAVIGSLIHFLIQLPKFRTYFDTKFKMSIKTLIEALKHKKTTLALKLAIPRTLGIFGEEINTLINTVISFSLAAGALSAYKFALSLHFFPINIIGGSIAQVALPNLTEQSESKKEFSKTFNQSIQTALFLVLPVVGIIAVLRLPLVRLAYGTGAFDWRATILTSWALVLLSFSIIGQTVVQILLRAFYALKETWLPLIAIVIGILVNIVLAYLLTNFFSHYYDWRPILEQMFLQIVETNGQGCLGVLASFVGDTIRWSTSRGDSDLAVGGLSLSLSVTHIVQTVFLILLLNKKRRIATWKKTIFPAMKKLFNTALMCIGMYFVFKLFDFQLDTTRTVSIIILTIITAGYGLLSYWLGSKVFKVKEISIVDNFLCYIKSNLSKRKKTDEIV